MEQSKIIDTLEMYHGSPCRRPWHVRIGLPDVPLTIIRVDEVANNPHIHVIHLSPKPILVKTSRTNGHCIVSNALVMSSLSMTVGLLSAFNRRAVHCTSLKLSCKDRPFTNALCWWPTNFGSSSASLVAKILSKILIGPLTRLTGL